MNAAILMTASATGTLPSLPQEYKPLETLDLCGNTLLGVSIPIQFRNVPVFLVGSGPFPLVWLAGPVDPTRENWRWVVEKSISRSNLIKVDIDASSAEVTVYAGSQQVLRVRSQGTGRATVTAFDLRPIGFAVHGSATGGIDVGNSKLSGNTFANAMSAISFS